MVLTVWRYISPDNFPYNPPYYVPDKVIDTATSVIWCERYQSTGEFELYMRATPELLRYFTENELLITRTETDRAMIPERVDLTTSTENGNYLKITGRSAESVMHRRIIEQMITLNRFQNAAAAVYYFAQENISGYWYYHPDSQHPKDSPSVLRYIPFLSVGNVTELPEKADSEPFGQNLGEFIEFVCKSCGWGFRIRFDRHQKRMYYECYKGDDKSRTVIFSENFQSIGATSYSFDRRQYYNRVMVAGEDGGQSRVTGARSYNHACGMILREKFIDAQSISSNLKEWDDLSPQDKSAAYYNLISGMANDELSASKEEICFDGEVLPSGQFRYRRDYCLGDTVSVQNAYGITGQAVVTEVTEVEDESGFRVIPKFSKWTVI